MKKLLIILIISMSTTAYANTAVAPTTSLFDKVSRAFKNPANARKIFNPGSVAGQIAFDKLMEGIDYVMNEGAEATKKDVEANKNESSTNRQSSYPYEYYTNGKVFSSAEDAHAYLISDAFLAKKRLKRTRGNDGLYYDKMTVDYRKDYMVLTSSVRVGSIDQNFENNIGGFITSNTARIYYVGTVSDKEVKRDDEQAENERKRKIVERLVRQYELDYAEAQEKETPKDKDKDKAHATDEAIENTRDNAQDKDNVNDEAKAKSSTVTKKEEKEDKEKEDKKEILNFCTWASAVCNFIDWMKKEEKKERTEIDIKDSDVQAVDTNIKFNSQCPADVIINANLYGANVEMKLFEWSKFCQILAMIKPIVIAMASFGAFKILGGTNNVND